MQYMHTDSFICMQWFVCQLTFNKTFCEVGVVQMGGNAHSFHFLKMLPVSEFNRLLNGTAVI